VVGIAGVCSALLTWLGLHLSQSDPSTYLVAARKWANDNSPTSHIAVGIASLLAHLTPLDAVTATAIGMLVGVALVGGLAFRHRGADVSQTTAELLPVVLYAAPLCFRCNAYDLVTVIPLFAWSRAHVTPKPLRYAIQALCLVLLVPRTALRIVSDKLAAGVVPYDTYRVGELTFRSWVLVLLLPLVLSALRARFDARSNRAPS
jgi:hypothetical protein